MEPKDMKPPASGGMGMPPMMQEMMQKMMPNKRKTRRMRVPDALRLIEQEEADKLVDEEAIAREGIELAFGDTIDVAGVKLRFERRA